MGGGVGICTADRSNVHMPLAFHPAAGDSATRLNDVPIPRFPAIGSLRC
jgi:hypothetical protein